MVKVVLKTPYEEKPLVLTWNDRKVTVAGSKEALAYWRYLESKGLYGIYGHILDMENSNFLDLLSALYNRVSRKDVVLNAEARGQRAKEQKDIKPVPENVTT